MEVEEERKGEEEVEVEGMKEETQRWKGRGEELRQ